MYVMIGNGFIYFMKSENEVIYSIGYVINMWINLLTLSTVIHTCTHITLPLTVDRDSKS